MEEGERRGKKERKIQMTRQRPQFWQKKEGRRRRNMMMIGYIRGMRLMREMSVWARRREEEEKNETEN